VSPGDQMRMEVEILQIRMRSARFKATVSVEGTVVSEAEMMCMLTERKATA